MKFTLARFVLSSLLWISGIIGVAGYFTGEINSPLFASFSLMCLALHALPFVESGEEKKE